MWTKPLPSPKNLFWVLCGSGALCLALFVLTISWLDVNEWWALAIGLIFAAGWAAALSVWIKQPMRQLAQEATTWVTQAEQGAQEMASQHNQAQVILDSMMEGVCALDREGRVLWVNRSAERLFGLQPQETTGKRLADLIRQPQVEALVNEVLQ